MLPAETNFLAQLPLFFRPHPNLSDAVNHNIIQSEIEGGVSVMDLAPETTLLIHTQHTCYRIVILEDGRALISGHPQYCPRPILVQLEGSTWGGSMLKPRYIGRGMCLGEMVQFAEVCRLECAPYGT